MRNSLFLLLLLPFLAVSAPRVSPPASILGNWLSPENNNWRYGFYTDFAILDGDFWEYSQVSVSGRQVKATLTNNGASKIIYIVKAADGSATIGAALTKLEHLVLKRNPSPDFKNFETAGFKQPLIKEGMVKLRGYLKGYDPAAANFKIVSIVHSALVEDEERSFIAEVDPLGRFTIDFPLLNPQEVMILFDKQNLACFAEPGKDLMVFMDITSLGKIPFPADHDFYSYLNSQAVHLDYMGASGPLNTELREHSAMLDKNRIHDAEEKMTVDDFKIYRMKLMNDQLQELESYSRIHRSGLKFVQQTKAFIKYSAASDLMRYNYKFRKAPVYSASYLEFVKEIPLNDPSAIVTSAYGDFLRCWLLSNFEVNGVSNWSEMPIAETIAEARIAGFTISEEDEQFIVAHYRYPGMIMADKKDSLKLQELFVKHNTALDSGVRRAYNKRDDRQRWKAISLAGDEQPDGIAKSILIAKKLILQFNENLLLSDSMLNVYEKMIVNPAVFAEVRKYHNRQWARIRGEVAPDIHVRNTAYQKGADVLTGLTEKYKGKVVYIDFWAPWCGPCMGEMPNSKRLQAEFKGRDVVFLYLGVQCSNDSWSATIKSQDIKGEHYLLSNDENSLLSSRFRISGIPRYMIVDKNGKVVDDDAKRPGESGVVNDIAILLK